LRDGVKWHDGKPFTSADVKCTWDLLTGGGAERLRLNPRNGRSRHRASIAAGITGEVEPDRCLARLMPEVARKPGAFAATPVFIVPDEIVPGAVNVKDLPT
jgi:peptide/nickel transport system substrate-binding protein